MANRCDNFDEQNARALMAANEAAVKNLREEIARLMSFLELRVLKATATERQLRENIRKNEAAVKELILKTEYLQAELDAWDQNRRRLRGGPELPLE